MITHWTEAFVSVFLNRGDGSFAKRVDLPSGLGSYGVDVADLDRDGHLDLVSANYRDQTISILRGRGDGTFALEAVVGVISIRSNEFALGRVGPRDCGSWLASLGIPG